MTNIEQGPSEARQGRNLKASIATGLLLAGLVIGLLIAGAVWFFGLVLVILLIAQAEFYLAVRKKGRDPAIGLGLVAGGVLLIGTFMRGETAAGLVMFLATVFSFIWYMAAPDREGLVADVGVTLFGVLYVPLLGAFAALLLRRPDGTEVVMAAIGAAAFYDIAAYAVGSRVGKRPIAPSVSPNKTFEGLVGGTVFLLATGPVLIALLSLGPWGYFEALVLCAMVAVVAPLGDLFESAVKRDIGVKDIGRILPGHGGALDRVDAILFAAPVAYLSLRMYGL